LRYWSLDSGLFSWWVDTLLLEPWLQLFYSGYAGDGVSLFVQASQDCDPPILRLRPSLGWQVHATTPSLPTAPSPPKLRWGTSQIFFCQGLVLNCDPTYLSLPHSLRWQEIMDIMPWCLVIHHF
jgi:hypothetical protein